MLNITVLLHNVIFSVAAGLFVQLNAELLVQLQKCPNWLSRSSVCSECLLVKGVSLRSLTQHWVHLPCKQPHPDTLCVYVLTSG